MERWNGRVAVVTGASSGIGAAIAKELVKNGMKVVGLARRVENIQALAEELKDAPGKLYSLKTDVTKEEDLLSAFKWVKENLGGVDVMVNNAGVVSMKKITEGDTSEWRQMLDVNIMALSICTREAIKSMKERGVDDGHIIHIGSVLGHTVAEAAIFYSSTKHAVLALTEGLRKELVTLKSSIKITMISPGFVKTEMATKNVPPEILKTYPILEPEDIASATIYTLSSPPRVQIHEIIIKPVGETS